MEQILYFQTSRLYETICVDVYTTNIKIIFIPISFSKQDQTKLFIHEIT